MDKLSLTTALSLKKPCSVAFYGGGGKTSLIFALARELSAQGEKVLITTTTKIFPFKDLKTAFLEEGLISQERIRRLFLGQNLVVLGRHLRSDGKIEGFSKEAVSRIQEHCSCYTLVEADGAKGRPVKGHASYEPVLPASADLIVPVVGADVIGAPVDEEVVHRLGIFKETVQKDYAKDYFDALLVARTFQHMMKLGRAQAPHAKLKPLLNKVDLLENPKIILDIARTIFESGAATELLGTVSGSDHPAKFNFNKRSRGGCFKVAAVLLAAGTAKRMGTDKLALPYKGHTILEETFAQLFGAGVDEIVIVARPGHRWGHLESRPGVKIVINNHYQTGQASSLICGLEAINSNTQAVLFALGDQPATGTALYKKLLDAYKTGLKKVTLPAYQGQRGNPVIFDRSLLPRLFKLKGDVGGRKIIQTLAEEEICMVQTGQRAVILDIDSPADYKKLLR